MEQELIQQLDIVWPERKWDDENRRQKWETLHPFVMEKYEEYVTTGKYPYLASVQSYIESFLPALNQLQKQNLHTQIYNASNKYRENQRTILRTKMLETGWLLLTDVLFEQAVKEKKNLELSGTLDSNLVGLSLKGVWKPLYDGDNRAFLIAPGKRRRGTYLSSLINAGETDVFCKLVKRTKNSF